MENKLFVRFMIFLSFGLSLWLFSPFLKSFFVALLLAMAVFPLHRVVEARIERIWWLNPVSSVASAGIVTFALSTMIIVPLLLFFYQLFDQPEKSIAVIRSMGERIDTLSSHLPSFLSWLKEPIDTLIALGKVNKDAVIATIAGWFGSGLKTFATMMGEMTMVVIFFFFLTWYGKRLALFFLPLIPLARTVKRKFISDVMTTTAVVFYTFGGVMLAQGVAFGVFIAFFEGYNPFVLGFMTGISAVIPVVGTAIVWIPVALNEYFDGDIFNAVVITIYSWAMMAFFIDNIVKLLILNFVNRSLSGGKSRINDFVIFFAIVAGLGTFGFWGFVFGPAIVAFAVSTLWLLRHTKRHVRQ